MQRVVSTVLCLCFLLGVSDACRTPPRPPAALIEGRRLLFAPRQGLEQVRQAIAHYQRAAAAAPKGPFAAEAAYALGLLTLELHLLALGPFSRVPALTRFLQRLQRAGKLSAKGLLTYARRVFTVARDGWQGAERQRAELALELVRIREQTSGVFDDLAVRRPAAPVRRYLFLETLWEQNDRLVRSAGHREIVERAVLLQRVSTLQLLRFLERGPGCPVLAFLSKRLLAREIDSSSGAEVCYRAMGFSRSRAKRRLARAAWVRLEEFYLDRPRSPFAPLVRRLFRAAPPVARRALRRPPSLKKK